MEKQRGLFCLRTTAIMLTLVLFAALCRPALAVPGATTICKWKDNKTAALTFSCDDNYANQAPFVDSVCYPRGIKMTWFLETNDAHSPLEGNGCCAWGGNWDLWRAMSARGHNIGSHTVTHPCLTGLTADSIRAELRNSKAKIEQEIPDKKCITIAWPSGCNDVTVRTIAAEYYIEGRGVSGAGYGADRNPVSPPTNFTDDNWSIWTQGVMGHTSSDIDLILSWGGWSNSYWHNVGDYNTFIVDCDYIYSKRNVLWTGSIREVAEYFYERDASTVQVVSAGTSQIILNVTHSLPTNVCAFDFPLTLKTEVAAGWDSVTVTQAGSRNVVRAVTESTKKYVYFDGRPNRGQITLTAGSTAIQRPAPILHAASNEPLPTAHPLRLEAWHRYLRVNTTTAVHDLGGMKIGPDALVRPGLYLVAQPGTRAIRRMLVVE
jgi:peptidoglycan/xylan/chitin deacetylase (PgdA/CDA1 family)